MPVKKTIIKAVSGKYSVISDSRTGRYEGKQSTSKTYTTGAIEKKTVLLQGKKDTFIYDYNVRLHGGADTAAINPTTSDDKDWIQKAEK
jgi:hypothetical protein